MRMLNSGIVLHLALWLTVLVGLVAISVALLLSGYILFAIITSTPIIFVIIRIVRLVMSYSHRAAFMFNAIENHDFSFRFAPNIGDVNEQYFNKSLNRIKDLISTTETQIAERERYYESIINSASIGILVFDPASGIVYQTNTAATTLLRVNGISHINQLEVLGTDIVKTLRKTTEGRVSTISFFNETSRTTLSVACSKIPLRGRIMTIVALSDIGQQLEDTMSESWIKLSRVLTHEIMNSLAPITSLSEELRKTTDHEVINRGLEIISSTSRSLISFVDNYRRLTRLPKPMTSRFDLSMLIRRTVGLMEREIDISLLGKNIEIVADENMISQVVINLISNAIEATDHTNKIWVSTSFDTLGRVIAEFSNDGPPIDRQTIEHIFIPFFTTKTGGSGIGLSLSRQIMHLNNGTLTHSTRMKNNVPITVFTLLFHQHS